MRKITTIKKNARSAAAHVFGKARLAVLPDVGTVKHAAGDTRWSCPTFLAASFELFGEGGGCVLWVEFFKVTKGAKVLRSFQRAVQSGSFRQAPKAAERIQGDHKGNSREKATLALGKSHHSRREKREQKNFHGLRKMRKEKLTEK
jgi:hypothetical protein